MCFYKIVDGSPKISNFGYPVSKITKNVHPYIVVSRPTTLITTETGNI